VLLSMVASLAAVLNAQTDDSKRPTDDSRVKRAAAHVKEIQMRSAFLGKDAKAKGAQVKEYKDVVELIDRPLLTYGDPARLNESGTLWAFGKVGRPVAFIEMFWGQRSTDWTHAVTLTCQEHRVVMTSPGRTRWTPQKTQIEPAAIPDASRPDAKESGRLRQIKDLARRFTAHEFWDPDNSRFELRLLVQPVHRYSDAKTGLQDGAAFVLAHGTNPEVILLIEALGETLDKARWHYSLARQGSAELHVELDGKEVWKQERTPGIVGRPTDPYWMF
jgi:hypothetical protein